MNLDNRGYIAVYTFQQCRHIRNAMLFAGSILSLEQWIKFTIFHNPCPTKLLKQYVFYSGIHFARLTTFLSFNTSISNRTIR